MPDNFTLTFPNDDGVLLVSIRYDLPSPGATFEYWTHDDHDPDELYVVINNGILEGKALRARLKHAGYVPTPTNPYEVIQWMAEAILHDAQNN